MHYISDDVLQCSTTLTAEVLKVDLPKGVLLYELEKSFDSCLGSYDSFNIVNKITGVSMKYYPPKKYFPSKFNQNSTPQVLEHLELDEDMYIR